MLRVLERLLKLAIAIQILVADALDFCAALFRNRTALVAENLFLRKRLALFQEREKKATKSTAADRFVLAKLARFFDWRSASDRQTGHSDRLASNCLPPLLALEVETSWATSNFTRDQALDPPRAGRKSHLRRPASCRRTLTETPDSILLAHGRQVHAAPATPTWIQRSAVVNLPPESRAWHYRLRLLCLRDGRLPYPLCICCTGDRIQTARPFQCHGTSDDGMDPTATTRSSSWRS